MATQGGELEDNLHALMEKGRDMIRKPHVAGQFYSRIAKQLKAQIEATYLSKFGPGSLPASFLKT